MNQNIKSYSVTAAAASLDPSSYTGGVGQLIYEIEPVAEPHKLRNELFELDDPERGTLTVINRNISETDYGNTSVTADSPFAALNIWSTVDPFEGTLQDYLDTWPVYGGVLSSISAVANPEIISPGFNGNLLDHLKDILSAYTLESYVTGSVLFIEEPRLREASVYRATSLLKSFDTQQTAQEVQMYYYPSRFGEQIEVWPTAADPSPSPFNVEANTLFTQELVNAGGLITVNQPEVVDWVENRPYDGTNGVYAVVGVDGLPITAAEWTARGGRLLVEIGDDPSILNVTVWGANIPDKSPFRIGAMSSGNLYSALHITGTGTVQQEKMVTVYTGAPLSETGLVVGATVQNPMVISLDQALKAGQYAAKRWSGITGQLSGSVTDMRLTESAGAMIRSDTGTNYRIVNTTAGFGQVGFDAETSNTWADFEALNPGLTCGEFAILYGGTCANFEIEGMRTWQ